MKSDLSELVKPTLIIPFTPLAIHSETLQRHRGTNATHNNTIATKRRLTRSEVS